MTAPTRSSTSPRADESVLSGLADNTGGLTRRQPAPSQHTGRTQDRASTPLYYDVPMLKPPVWKWEITSYFFLGGLSAGAYVLARLAARFGPQRYREVTRAGAAIAAATMAPCPLLLIRDLGDSKRFHFMLRVFKPGSPMNLGSWTLTGYGAMATLAALNEWRKGRRDREEVAELEETSLPVRIADGALDAVLDGAGISLALLLAGYTGVLLSTTANPLWTRNSWLGALFSASAISTGVSAINLAREVQDPEAEAQPAHRPLQRVETAARVAEAVTLAGFLTTAGELAAPITKGKYAPHLWGGAIGAGLVLSTALGHLPVKSEKTRRALRIGGAIAGLAGGLALRWAITQGGHPSGSDPQAARQSSRPEK